jgi:hypothetical protein
MRAADEDLTPAEALVLLEPNKVSGRSVVRTSLLHLAAAGYLRAEVQAKRSWLGTGGGTRLVRTDAAGPLPDHLAGVLNALFPPAKSEASLSPAEVTSRLQRAFGYDYARYLALHIRPLLLSKALLSVEEYRWMRIVPRRRYLHTDAGMRLRERIGTRLRGADGLPELLRSDPRRAAAAAAGLGGLVLIAEGLRPHLGELANAARSEPSITLIATLEADEDERRNAWLEGADLFAEVDWGAILDAVSGVGDAFDAGGDSAGGDGGGDGGGGGE